MTESVNQITPYGTLVDDLRQFLDRITLAAPDDQTAAELSENLRNWSQRLQRAEVPPELRPYGRSHGLPGNGQVMTPQYSLTYDARDRMTGTATFGTHFTGGLSVAHGGTVPLLFDEAFGWLANSSERLPSRTAYLHVDYRSVVHLNRELDFRIWLDRTEGRKHFLRGEISDSGTLCAESRALFVELLPGQP